MARQSRSQNQVRTDDSIASDHAGIAVRRQRGRLAFASVAVLLTLVMSLSPLLTTAQSDGPERPRAPVFIEPGVRGPSVVLVDPGVDPASVAADNDVAAERVFTTATTAFATSLEEDQVTQLANDERVRAIVIDHEITAAEMSTGVERIGAATSPMSTIGTGATTPASIAIIDSGVSTHPDLNVVGGTDVCAPDPTGSYADVTGHGTHVAGIAAARDNGVGVVGVAPGASIYSVRVLASNGRGYVSNLICGLEWVLQNASLIDVVNMSLVGTGPAGGCADHPLHQAVCNVSAAGIVMVAAAGNYRADASLYIPALYPEVVTVSSFTDTNGRPGGGGGSCDGTADDFFSGFSNFGAAVDIMAPGGCIYSTIPGGYGTLSGTSMAAPHVAGALALYIANNGAGGAVSWLLNSAGVPQNSTFGIEGGDSDGSAEPVLYVGDGSLNPTATPTRQATATPTRQATATPTRQVTATPTTGVRPPRPGGSTATATPTRAASATPQATNTPTVSPTRAATATPTSGVRPPRPGRGTATAPAPATSTATRVAGSTPTPTVVGPTRPPRIRSTSQVPTVTPTAGTVRPTPSSTPGRPPRIRWVSQAEATASPTVNPGGAATVPPMATATSVAESAEAADPTATQARSWPTATPTSVLPTVTPTQVPPTSTPALVPTELPPTEVPPTEMPIESVPTEVPVGDSPATEMPTEDVPTEAPIEEVPTEAPTIAETPTPLPVYDVTDTLDQATAWYAADATVETAWYLPVPTPTEAPVVEEPTVADVPTDGSEAGDGTERQRSPEETAGEVPADAAAVESAPTDDVPPVEHEVLHLTVDLGSEQQIETVRWLLDDYRYADSMEIQVSLDGETWTTVAWPPDVAEWQVLDGEWQEAELGGTTARYVRFMFPNWNGDEVVGGIAEVEIIPVATPTE